MWWHVRQNKLSAYPQVQFFQLLKIENASRPDKDILSKVTVVHTFDWFVLRRFPYFLLIGNFYLIFWHTCVGPLKCGSPCSDEPVRRFLNPALLVRYWKVYTVLLWSQAL